MGCYLDFPFPFPFPLPFPLPVVVVVVLLDVSVVSVDRAAVVVVSSPLMLVVDEVVELVEADAAAAIAELLLATAIVGAAVCGAPTWANPVTGLTRTGMYQLLPLPVADSQTIVGSVAVVEPSGPDSTLPTVVPDVSSVAPSKRTGTPKEGMSSKSRTN